MLLYILLSPPNSTPLNTQNWSVVNQSRQDQMVVIHELPLRCSVAQQLTVAE